MATFSWLVPRNSLRDFYLDLSHSLRVVFLVGASFCVPAACVHPDHITIPSCYHLFTDLSYCQLYGFRDCDLFVPQNLALHIYLLHERMSDFAQRPQPESGSTRIQTSVSKLTSSLHVFRNSPGKRGPGFEDWVGFDEQRRGVSIPRLGGQSLAWLSFLFCLSIFSKYFRIPQVTRFLLLSPALHPFISASK